MSSCWIPKNRLFLLPAFLTRTVMRLNHHLDFILSISQFTELNFGPDTALGICRRNLLQPHDPRLGSFDLAILPRPVARILDDVNENRQRECTKGNQRAAVELQHSLFFYCFQFLAP